MVRKLYQDRSRKRRVRYKGIHFVFSIIVNSVHHLLSHIKIRGTHTSELILLKSSFITTASLPPPPYTSLCSYRLSNRPWPYSTSAGDRSQRWCCSLVLPQLRSSASRVAAIWPFTSPQLANSLHFMPPIARPIKAWRPR